MKNMFNTDISNLRKKFTEKSNQQHSLATLISKKQWDKVHDILIDIIRDDDKDNTPFHNCHYQYKCCKKCKDGHSLLHLLLRNHPPTEILLAMLDVVPYGPFETDCLKRYPLHIATKYGSSVDNVEILLTANPKAAEACDVNGQTPLHLLFHDYKWKTQKKVNFGSKLREATFDICELLCEEAPSVVLIEEDGVSLIEKALSEDADVRVVRYLQRLTRKLLREQSYNVKSAALQKEVYQAMIDLKHELDKGKAVNIFSFGDRQMSVKTPSVENRRMSIMVAPVMREVNSRTA